MNASSLPISEIAERTARPERTIGTHWRNPPELIPVVEIILGGTTSAAVAERTVRFVARLGKVPVRVARDVAGFVGNRLQHALWREAIALLQEGAADAREIGSRSDGLPNVRVASGTHGSAPKRRFRRPGPDACSARAYLPTFDPSSEPTPLLVAKATAQGKASRFTDRSIP